MGDAHNSLAARATGMWESSESIPSVEMMIASIAGGRPRERASAIVVDQQRRWRIGLEASAEHYLHHCPDLAADPQNRLQVVMGGFEARGSRSQLLPEFVRRERDSSPSRAVSGGLQGSTQV